MKNFEIGITGNPNSGKTTVFNALTGSRQHVGNWPGVTVERKEGYFSKEDSKYTIIDLPGIYSLSAYSMDEIIARDYIIKNKPDLVLDVLDGSNLERNLYLLVQILEMQTDVVGILNMIDIANKRGLKIDDEKLSNILKIPIIRVGLDKNKDKDLLKNTIHNRINENDTKSYIKIDYGRTINEAISKIVDIFDEYSYKEKYPNRWLAIKLLEGDIDYLNKIDNFERKDEILNIINSTEKQIEMEYSIDLESYIVERRYAFINGLYKECVHKTSSIEDKMEITDKIDKIVTNKYLGIPIFLVVMWAMFQSVFTLGQPLVDLIDNFFGFLSGGISQLLISINSPDWIVSFITDGLIGGVGSVAVFVPNIAILYLVMAFLQDTGYMSRVAFIMDKFMHKIGLHGKSFIPMILGFGCNIPAILATRTLESKKDRILTIITVPFVSCSARLPVYVLFAGAFFKNHAGLVVFSLYFLGILLAIGSAKILKTVFFKDEEAPLIMELPPYHVPQWKGIFIHTWFRTSLFLKKMTGVILAGVVVIWFLSSMPFGVEYASAESWLGQISEFVSVIFKPAGFGFWQGTAALVFGIIAKELVIGTLGTTLELGAEGSLKLALANYFTPLSAYAFLVMIVTYIPCIATIGAIKKEAGWKWALFSSFYSLGLGWLLAVLVYQLGSLF